MTDTDVDETTEATSPPGRSAAPPPGRPPLARNTHDKVIAGVAGGVARHFGWDPLLVRIGFVLLVFLGGAGLLAYIAGWIMLPRDSDVEASTYRTAADLEHRGLAFWIGIGLLALASLALLGDTGLLDAGFIVAVALVAIGVAIWRSGDHAPRSPIASSAVDDSTIPAATRTTEPVGAQAHALEAPGGHDLPPPTAPTPPAPVTHEPSRPRPPASYLGRITFALALIATAVAVALERGGALDLSAAQILGIPLVVLAGGLVVGTWWGRGRWLILPSLVIALALPGAAVADEMNLSLRHGIGEEFVSIASAADVRDERLSIGSLTLDLDDLVLGRTGREFQLETSVGIGELVIRLPDDPDIGYRIEATTRFGEVTGADGRSSSGRSTSRTFTREARNNADTVVIDATVGAGVIEIVD